MPILFHVVAGYTAGLMLGLADLRAWGAGAALLALAAAAKRRSAGGIGLALTLAAGAVVGHDAARERVDCIEAARRAPSVTVALEERARPGGYARGWIVAGACRLPAGLMVAEGTARPGQRARAAGRIVRAGRGVRIVDARLRDARDGSLRERWIASSGASIDRYFGPNAPVVRALLIADARSIPPAVRDRFAAAGLVHMLSISGLHVAIIAAAVMVALRAARSPPRWQALGTVILVAIYVALLGAPAPAVRSAVMLAVVAASQTGQRPVSAWAALAAGAMIPLMLDSHTVRDLGWQLSVAGMASLIAAARVYGALPLPRRGILATIGGAALTSVIATAVTAPLVAWHFGQLSLVAPLSNLVAAPIVTFLQPVLFLALIFAPVPPVAALAADAAQPLLWLLDRIAAVAAAVPFAAITVSPTMPIAALCGMAAALAVMAAAHRRPARLLVAAAATLAATPWLPPPRGDGHVEMHVLDVGQGDAIAIRTGRGRWVLVDAGRSWRGGDAGRATVIPYLRRHGGDLLAFVLSHPHADHAGGAATVIEALRPARYFDGAYVLGSEPYARSLAGARRARVAWTRARPGQVITVDDVTLRVLAPDSAWMTTVRDPNEASVVLLVEVGAVRFLLAGDAEGDEERWLVERWGGALRADVLKVGHHGSRTSTGVKFLDLVRPRFAIVSVGAANGYGHPSAEVLRSLAAGDAEIFRTDRVGTVVVRTDGRRIEVRSAAEAY